MLILIMLYIGVLFLIGNVIYYFISGKHGRRWLLLASTLPLGFSILAIEVVVIANINSGSFVLGKWITVVGLSVFIVSYSFGLGTQPWTICTEIFPNHLRGNANAITTTCNWFSLYFIVSFFPKYSTRSIGKIACFSILAFLNFLIFFFV